MTRPLHLAQKKKCLTLPGKRRINSFLDMAPLNLAKFNRAQRRAISSIKSSAKGAPHV